MVVAAVVALLVLVGGGAAAVVALSGDDDDDKKDDAKTSESASPTTDDPTEDPSEEPTDEPTDEPTGDGDRVVSDGYSYEIPDEWIDATEELSAAGAPGSIDTVIAWGSQLQSSRANMIVETQAAGGATDPEEMRAQWEATMTQAAGGEAPEAAEGITVDGVDSIGVRFQRDNGAGIEIVQRAYLMISGDTAYAITLSYQPDDDGVVSDTFDEIIDSWDFTD